MSWYRRVALEALMFLLPKGSPLFEKLAASKLKLPDVLSKLSNGSFTGYASFVFQTNTVILVFEAGKLVSVLVEGDNGMRETGFQALSTLAELMVTTGSGALNVYKLSKDLTMCIHALLEGKTLYKAQDLKLIDINSLLKKVKDDQMNGYGILTCTDGSKFDGCCKHNMKNGFGICTYNNGNVYQGYWDNNHMAGYG